MIKSHTTNPFLLGLAMLGLSTMSPNPLTAQEAGGRWSPQVEIPWNRYYDHGELQQHMESLQQAYPGFVEIVDIGESFEGRPMRVMIVTNEATGDDREKVGMWVDGNVHGNEVQGGEAAIYLAWWLLEHYDTNERAKDLLDRRVFYILPSQNPDGRDHWFASANTAHSSRTGTTPTDNDRDGLFDEDDTDDLDGDGEILLMRKKVPPRRPAHPDPRGGRPAGRLSHPRPGRHRQRRGRSHQRGRQGRLRHEPQLAQRLAAEPHPIRRR
ncbi:MAG: M14 family zinc carboxypeptidase [Planctomycetota bacterium]|jgi:hypothetical protein